MAAIADGIDFLYGMVYKDSSKGMGRDIKGEFGGLSVVYIIFLFMGTIIFGRFSTMDFSATVTGASLMQFCGLTLLTVKVHATKCVKGLSSKMFTLFALQLALRLSSTSIKNGYVPVDKSGDAAYQLLDFGTLVLCLVMLFNIHKTYVHSYTDEHDQLPLLPLVLPCVMFGICVHGSFNADPFFDSVWQISSNLEAFVLVPQVWMLSCMGGKVDPVTAHFVACMVASGVLSFTFWWWTGVELEKRGRCWAHHVIIGAQAVRLLTCADFMHYYARAQLVGSCVELPSRDAEM